MDLGEVLYIKLCNTDEVAKLGAIWIIILNPRRILILINSHCVWGCFHVIGDMHYPNRTFCVSWTCH